jgi:hypothetical protein
MDDLNARAGVENSGGHSRISAAPDAHIKFHVGSFAISSSLSTYLTVPRSIRPRYLFNL